MILIAIGANLPDRHGAHPLATCRAAAEALRSLPGLRLVALSRWYATAPIPASDQPDYINGLARLEGPTPDPETLLALLHTIETRANRTRGAPNAPRTLDLDLIGIGNLIRPANPILPHPRAHLRAFVLRPLHDVAPDWQHPILHQTAASLLAALPPQGINLL